MRFSVPIALAAALLAPLAQAAGRMPESGNGEILYASPTPIESSAYAHFLAAIGRTAGGNTARVSYFQVPASDRKPRIDDLIARSPAVVVTQDVELALALRSRDYPVPVVFVTLGNPVEQGLVERFSARSREVTGIMLAREPLPKQLELLRECIGTVRRVGVLTDRRWAASERGRVALRSIAATGVVPVVTIADSPAEVERSLARPEAGLDGWLVVSTPVTVDHPGLVVRRFNALGVPVIYANPVFVKSGAALSYDSTVANALDRLAFMAVQVSRGVPARDIPIEVPGEYRLALNVAAAERSAWRIPRSVVKRAQVFQ